MGWKGKHDPPRVRADYLRGDPAEDGPITRGTLELAPQGLRFTVPGGPELSIEFERLEGLTVSGRSPYERPRRHARGTMLVAARRNGAVDVWEFAVARKAGAVLRDRIHRELHARGLRRPPLPFVEQIVGPVPPPGERGQNGGTPSNGAGSTDPEGAEGKFRLRRPRTLLFVLGAALVLAAEVAAVVFLLG